ncbi:MAG TPA: tetratricopeptide repeat protein [Mycobacteriales bacterium]|nr:tetratricopeptide repeat protein [Mycobacteriales bacterium]
MRTLPRVHHRAAPAPADQAARLLRLLGVYPGPSAAMGSVAALAGVSRPVARAAVARLAADGLVDTVGDRVVVPDRLRAATADTAETRTARGRLLRHLLTRAIAAAAVAAPDGPTIALPPFRSAAGARAWLAAELPTLLAVPDPAFALRLAPALGEQLADNDALLLYQRAAADGDPDMRLRLGLTLCRLGRHGEAAEHLRAALPRLDRPTDRAPALLHLAGCRERQGRRVEALAWYAEAYEACLRAGDRVGRSVALRRLRTRAAA